MFQSGRLLSGAEDSQAAECLPAQCCNDVHKPTGGMPEAGDWESAVQRPHTNVSQRCVVPAFVPPWSAWEIPLADTIGSNAIGSEVDADKQNMNSPDDEDFKGARVCRGWRVPHGAGGRGGAGVEGQRETENAGASATWQARVSSMWLTPVRKQSSWCAAKVLASPPTYSHGSFTPSTLAARLLTAIAVNVSLLTETYRVC